MKTIANLSCAVLLTIFFSVAVFGQGNSVVSMTFEIPTEIKGVPYSAESATEHVQTLADGNRITRISKTMHYRDGEGRTRIDMLEQSDLPPEIARDFLRFRISDPIAGYTYMFNSGNKTVMRRKIFRPNAIPRPSTPPAPRPGYSSRREELGSRVIDGIETVGTRYVHITAPGTIGNEKTIEAVYESWYSPTLKVTLLSTSNDPRSGVSTTRLINLKRDEPDKMLFEIPADYKIVDQ